LIEQEGVKVGRTGRRLLSIKETVDAYGVTPWFWRTAVWNNHIPVVRIGRKILFDVRDIEKFIERNKAYASET